MRLNIMAFGDTHGLEDIAYKMVKRWEKRHKQEIHIVLFPGDLDEVIHIVKPDVDIESTIADYHYRRKKAPYPTFFVAGNMDEWGILRWFPGAGWIASNFCFLGRSGYEDFMGIRIAGLSGVYNKKDYEKPLPKEPSFIPWQHYRKNEVDHLKGLNPDIIVLHEWVMPDSIEHFERKTSTSRKLPEMKDTPVRDAILEVQPKYVFMGHDHDCYIDGKIGETQIYGLMQITEKTDLKSYYCYKVGSIETPL